MHCYTHYRTTLRRTVEPVECVLIAVRTLMRLQPSPLPVPLPVRSRWLPWVSTLIELYIPSSPGERGPIFPTILLRVKATGMHCSMMLHTEEMTVKSAWSSHTPCTGTPVMSPILFLINTIPVIRLELSGTFSRITVAVLRSLDMERGLLFSLCFPAWTCQVRSEGCPPWCLGSPCSSAIFLFFP